MPIVPSKPLNILAIALASPGDPSKIHSNKDVQDIIQVVIEARSAAAKIPLERLFKAWFPDVYKSNNHIACYSFC